MTERLDKDETCLRGSKEVNLENIMDVIGTEQVAEATAILQKYKAGKAALDKRIVDNELWFRMGHWKNYQNPMMDGGKPQPASGWLFNSIANKHADAMDNYPAPNVLPRAADDVQTAQVLSSILPVALEQADYEQVYSDTWWRKLKQGTGVKGVFWDPEAPGRRGRDRHPAHEPAHALLGAGRGRYPGLAPLFFSLSMEEHKTAGKPLAPAEGPQRQCAGCTPFFLHDGGLDTTEKKAWWWTGTTKSRTRPDAPCSTTASSSTAWCSTPARTTRPPCRAGLL